MWDSRLHLSQYVISQAGSRPVSSIAVSRTRPRRERRGRHSGDADLPPSDDGGHIEFWGGGWRVGQELLRIRAVEVELYLAITGNGDILGQ